AVSAAPRRASAATSLVYGACLVVSLVLGAIALFALYRNSAAAPAATVPLAQFAHRRAGRLLPHRGQSWRRGGEPVRARLRAPRACAATGAAVLPGLPRRDESRGHGRRRLQLPGVVGVHVADVLGAGGRQSRAAREHARRLCLSDD